jgi:hypothetical protein
LIVKFDRKVYILRKNKDEGFKVEGDPINQNEEMHFGGLSHDAELLALYNPGNKQIRLYKLTYG